jgi:hypothetical protein
MRFVQQFRCVAQLAAISLAVLQSVAFGRDFVNLNFEDATVQPTPVGQFGGFVDPALAFPGWIVSNSFPSGLSISTATFYNDLSLGSPAVCLMGPDFPSAVESSPLEGSYSVLLMTFSNSFGGRPTLSQTGMIPANAKSINFLVGSGETNALVTLNGVFIPLVPIAGGRLAGDVTAFAGSVAELTFSTTIVSPDLTTLYFDDVQFSPAAIPEQSASNLLAIGVASLVLLHRTCRKNGQDLRSRREAQLVGMDGMRGA